MKPPALVGRQLIRAQQYFIVVAAEFAGERIRLERFGGRAVALHPVYLPQAHDLVGHRVIERLRERQDVLDLGCVGNRHLEGYRLAGERAHDHAAESLLFAQTQLAQEFWRWNAVRRLDLLLAPPVRLLIVLDLAPLGLLVLLVHFELASELDDNLLWLAVNLHQAVDDPAKLAEPDMDSRVGDAAIMGDLVILRFRLIPAHDLARQDRAVIRQAVERRIRTKIGMMPVFRDFCDRLGEAQSLLFHDRQKLGDRLLGQASMALGQRRERKLSCGRGIQPPFGLSHALDVVGLLGFDQRADDLCSPRERKFLPPSSKCVLKPRRRLVAL
jgi:hypothetical protein